MQYNDFERQLRRIDYERNRLWFVERNLGWEPIMEPYQRGWERTFVLRSDVARSPRASFYEAMLKKINTVEYCHRKDLRTELFQTC
jgi:hypothetical protein